MFLLLNILYNYYIHNSIYICIQHSHTRTRAHTHIHIHTHIHMNKHSYGVGIPRSRRRQWSLQFASTRSQKHHVGLRSYILHVYFRGCIT